MHYHDALNHLAHKLEYARDEKEFEKYRKLFHKCSEHLIHIFDHIQRSVENSGALREWNSKDADVFRHSINTHVIRIRSIDNHLQHFKDPEMFREHNGHNLIRRDLEEIKRLKDQEWKFIERYDEFIKKKIEHLKHALQGLEDAEDKIKTA